MSSEERKKIPVGNQQYFSDEVLQKAKTARLYIEHLYKSQSQSFRERLNRYSDVWCRMTCTLCHGVTGM